MKKLCLVLAILLVFLSGCASKTETVSSVFAVMEYIRCCLVNGNGSGICGGVCLFLSYV